MKSTTRNLVAVAAGIVVLGGVIAALTLSGGGSTPSSSSEASTPNINLVSKKPADIASMEVTNKKGSYTIVPQDSSSLKSSSSGAASSSDVTYTIKELNGAPIDTSSTENVVKYAYSLAASKNLGEVSDIGQYGLNDPQATVKIRFKDNTSYNYKIGKVTPSDASSYYMCADNSKTVYIVSLDSALLQDKMDFVQKTILTVTPPSSTSSTSQSANDFTKIALSGTNFPQDITIEKGKTSYTIKTTVTASTDDDKLSALTKQLETVTATSAASIKPDAAALKKYGFDKPSAVIKFTVNGKSYKLTAGAKNGANRYVMLEGTDVIYITTNASVDAWADASYFTLRSKFVLLPLITDVSGMTVTSGSEVNTFAIARTKDEKKSTEDTPAYTYTVTGNNGKKLTYDKNFKNYYQTVISATLLEDYSKKPSGTPAATIEYKYFDGSKHIVQFYNAADRRFAAVVDGIVCGLVKSTDVDTIISNTKLMENDTLVSVE